MTSLHVHFPVPRRIDRLQLLSRLVRHAQPLLNCLDEQGAEAEAEEVEPRRRA